MVYIKTELMKLKVPALKIIASGKGIVHSGVKKEDLVDSIIEIGDADCAPPKIRDSKTKKCVKKKRVKNIPISACPEGQLRDKDSNDCSKIVYDKTELMKLKVPALKIIASGKGIVHSGVKKEDLVDRIIETGDADCVAPKTRDPITKKCVTKKKVPREPCPEGQIRDKDTNECRDKKRGKKAKVVVEDEVVAKDATCESILTSKGCDDKEITHDGFKLRECIWTNGDNSCKARIDNLEDRLQSYLGLNSMNFVYHVETIRVITKEIQRRMVADKLDFSKAVQKYKKDKETELLEKHDTYMKAVDKTNSMLKIIKKSIDEKSYRTLRDKLKEFKKFSKDLRKSRTALNNGTVNLIEYIDKLKKTIGNTPYMQDNGDEGEKLIQGYIDLDQNEYKIKTMSVREQPVMLLHIHDLLEKLVKSTKNKSVIDTRDSLFEIPEFSEWMRVRKDKRTAVELEKQIEKEKGDRRKNTQEMNFSRKHYVQLIGISDYDKASYDDKITIVDNMFNKLSASERNKYDVYVPNTKSLKIEKEMCGDNNYPIRTPQIDDSGLKLCMQKKYLEEEDDDETKEEVMDDYSFWSLQFKENNKDVTLPKKWDVDNDFDYEVRNESMDVSIKKLKELVVDYLEKGIYPDEFSTNRDERYLFKWAKSKFDDRGLMSDNEFLTEWDNTIDKYEALFYPDEVETSDDEQPGDFGGGDDQIDYSAMPPPFKDNNKGGTLTKKPKKYEDDESSDEDDSGVRDKSALDESFLKNLKALETDYLSKGIFPDKFSKNQDERFLATWIILISSNREMERGSMQDERARKIWDDLTDKYQSLFNPEESDESEDEKPPSPPKKGKKPKPKKTVVVESDDEESEPVGASQAYYGLYEYSDKYDGDKSKRKFSIIKVVDTDTTDKRLLPSGLGCTSFTGAKKAEIDSLVKKLYSITKEFGKPPTKRLSERCDWIEKVMESLGLIMRDTNL
jgi:hypothetical protein